MPDLLAPLRPQTVAVAANLPSLVTFVAAVDLAADGPLPLTLDEALAIVAELEAALVPGDPERISREWGHTSRLWPAAEHPEEAMVFGMEALEDVPFDIVLGALKRLRQRCRYFPRPAEIREAVDELLGPRKRALLKARAILAVASRGRCRPPAPHRSEPSEDEKARVSEVVGAYVRRYRASAAAT